MKIYNFLFTLVLSIVGFYAPLFAQIQIGADIDGEAAGDQSGFSVSMPDAYTVAIGANINDGAAMDAGHVRVYTWNGNSWVQKGADIDGQAKDDYAGVSVWMPDSNTVAVGASGSDDNGNSSGQTRIFSWDGNAWVQKGQDINGEASGDYSGLPVRMPDANTIAIGASANSDAGSYAGHVRIYRWNGIAWVQKGLDIDGEASYDESGYGLSMPDSNTVAIGAPYSAGNGAEAGHVRIYTWDGNAWVQKGTDIDGEAAGDESGVAVSMPDANTVAIGAQANDGTDTLAGHVRIFSWDGNAWVQKGADIDGEAKSDISGGRVDMPDANTVAIGAIGNTGDGLGAATGHVRIFSWDGNAWVQMGMDINGEAAGDQCGFSISMPNANIVAIGARSNDGNGNSAGHVRIYKLCTPTAESISPMTCDTYTSPSGKYTWDTSGTYMDTLVNNSGCDSVLTISLTVTEVDTTVAYMFGFWEVLDSTASYQWLDCDNAMAAIVGDTSRYFSPNFNGNYAVEITKNGCIDTSACNYFGYIGIAENQWNNIISVYPNPTTGQVTIQLAQPISEGQLTVRNILGQTVLQKSFNHLTQSTISLPDAAGIYFVEVFTETGKTAVVKVVKE